MPITSARRWSDLSGSADGSGCLTSSVPPSSQATPESPQTSKPYERLLGLRLHQTQGRRSPHKPLLALLAIGRLLETGLSDPPWSVAKVRLADLIAEFGPASQTAKAQGAAYPFTRLRADGVWQLDADVPDDRISSLQHVTGSFVPTVEAELRKSPARALATAQALVISHFPQSLVNDVLIAAGLEPELVLGSAPVESQRRRSTAFRVQVIEAWDYQCAFCGWDGQLGGAAVGLDAAHVRWFLRGTRCARQRACALLAAPQALRPWRTGPRRRPARAGKRSFTARTETGKAVYDLHGVVLRPRPGTALPAAEHVSWHDREVFKGEQISA